MKRYLWLVMVLFGISAFAESNPFDLQENLHKIDQDQDVLLSALKEMADKKEAFEDTMLVNEPEANTSNLEENSEVLLPSEQLKEKVEMAEMIPEENNTLTPVLPAEGAVDDNLTTEDIPLAIQEAAMQKAEEERIAKVKAEQAKIEQARAQKEAEGLQVLRAQEEEKLAAQKREEERLEVEAYEAKRLAKIEEERLAAEAKAAAQMQVAEEVEVKDAVADINITREKIMAKEAADKAYLEAVKEMGNKN